MESLKCYFCCEWLSLETLLQFSWCMMKWLFALCKDSKVLLLSLVIWRLFLNFVIKIIIRFMWAKYPNQRAVTDLGCYHTTKDQRRLINLIISWYSKNRQFSISSTAKLSIFGNLHLKPAFNFHGTTQPLLIYSFPELIWLLEAPFMCGTNCYRHCSHSKRHCLKIVWGH